MNKRKIIFIILIICWLGFIFYFSSMDTYKSNGDSKEVVSVVVDKAIDISNSSINDNKKEDIVNVLNLPIRKLAHFSLYFILSILVMSFLVSSNKFNLRNIILISIIFCFIYACSDEYHQTFINGRTGQFSDVIIDTIGASIGSIIYSIGYNKLIKKYR